MERTEKLLCNLCHREMNIEGDNSSIDCGGDCWRCVAEAESDYPMPAADKHVKVDYTNYRGERSIRTITPWSVTWGSNEYHPHPQWLLTCYDHDKFSIRVYALADIHSWNGLHTSNQVEADKDNTPLICESLSTYDYDSLKR